MSFDKMKGAPLKRQNSAHRRYLSSDAMKTTANSLAMIASVTNFDLVELWTSYPDGEVNIVFVYVDDSTLEKFPTIITGHHPKKKTEHVISPQLVGRVSEPNPNFFWRSQESKLYPEYYLPIMSEFVYRLEGDTGELSMFVVGLGFKAIEVKDSTPKFLSGLLYATFIAVFNSEETFSSNEDLSDGQELDLKEFVPETVINNGTPRSSSADLYSAGNAVAKAIVTTTTAGADVNNTQGNGNALGPPMQAMAIKTETSPAAGNEGTKQHSQEKAEHSMPIDLAVNIPCWEPATDFAYPVALIPPKYRVNDQLTFASFSDVRHLADGSNANVFLAMLQGQKVIIKMIKEAAENSPIAIHEFDQEFGMLARMNHPHIIKVLGAGLQPRKFIVLEWLGGGSLNTILAQHQSTSGLTNMLFRKPSFTYNNLLEKARDMAQAFDYLHFRCHPGASILHRDLKPDNIGFTADGTLKLFDFGLVTCVKARKHSNDSYKMTGYTGSLRYMAPEVALREPYTEKVDVYSFGIMLWQMAKDRLPFKGLNKADFMRDVVKGNLRPKIDKTWPAGFNQLLSACWDRSPDKRPSFAMIVIDLNKLITDCGGAGAAQVKPSAPSRGKQITKANSSDMKGGADTQSSWF